MLDASALLALLSAEPGSDKVAENVPGAAISAVNLSEVVSKLIERGVPEQAVRSALQQIELEIHSFGEDLAYQAGVLKLETRSAGLSFGDRACLALGRKLAAPVLTTERNWKELDLGVEIRVIR